PIMQLDAPTAKHRGPVEVGHAQLGAGHTEQRTRRQRVHRQLHTGLAATLPDVTRLQVPPRITGFGRAADSAGTAFAASTPSSRLTINVNLDDGRPRCTNSGTSRPRYPTIDVTPGALRGGATTNSQLCGCSSVPTDSR